MRAVAWICRLGVLMLAGALLVSAVAIGVAPRVLGVRDAWTGTPVVLGDFQELARSSRAVDAHGNTIALFRQENSQPRSLAQMSPEAVQAFLDVEDRDFYAHNGVNLRGLFRATVSNVAADSGQQGASTITMQVAKNEYLGGFDRDLRYKILQVHYAQMLEQKYSKEEILERYLNTVFFGNRAYGLEAAAQVYFGTSAAELTKIQGAFLAGLVQSPSAYNPIANPERSRARFAQVLRVLVDVGSLTPEEAELERSTFQVPSRVLGIPEEEAPPRTYYSVALTDYLLNRSDILGGSREERLNALYRGGLTIQTTLDPTLQAYAQDAHSILPRTDQGFDAAILSLDSRTGAIVAMVGGRDFSNLEVNMALSPRQTGSAGKIFILAAAVQAGVRRNDVIDGTTPCEFIDPNDRSKTFPIRNATGGGVDTITEHTARSINCAYARLSQIVGLHRVVDTVYRMSHSAYLNRELSAETRTPIQPYASFATGANEMSPLDMASAAQTLANEGLHHDPYYVQRIVDWRGNEVYVHDDPGEQVLDRDAALETTEILKSPLDYGTARRYDIDRPAAGKTGTQDSNTNAWFVGYTVNFATAVWIGDPNGHTPMVNIPGFDQNRVQGGLYPTEIWQAYMQRAEETRPAGDWPQPSWGTREAYRLFLPGNECVYRVTGYRGGDVQLGDDPNAPEPAPGDTRPQVPIGTTPVSPIVEAVPTVDTIPASNLDPRAGVPSFPVSHQYVYRKC